VNGSAPETRIFRPHGSALKRLTFGEAAASEIFLIKRSISSSRTRNFPQLPLAGKRFLAAQDRISVTNCSRPEFLLNPDSVKNDHSFCAETKMILFNFPIFEQTV
jgi:hypothetical protein